MKLAPLKWQEIFPPAKTATRMPSQYFEVIASHATDDFM